jgi:hypothetical protein
MELLYVSLRYRSVQNNFLTIKKINQMARKKLVSRPLGKLNKRTLGLNSIQEGLVLKNGVSVDSSNALQNKLQAAIDDHYLTGVLLDEKSKAIKVLQKEADALSKQILNGVINDYGDDSIHVTKVGGIRASERAKPLSKAEKALKAEKKSKKTA